MVVFVLSLSCLPLPWLVCCFVVLYCCRLSFVFAVCLGCCLYCCLFVVLLFVCCLFCCIVVVCRLCLLLVVMLLLVWYLLFGICCLFVILLFVGYAVAVCYVACLLYCCLFVILLLFVMVGVSRGCDDLFVCFVCLLLSVIIHYAMDVVTSLMSNSCVKTCLYDLL